MSLMGRILLQEFIFVGFHMYGISENALLKILTEIKNKRDLKNRRKQIMPSIFYV
jgi:hypothetical protein